jgi:hypothetical protein
MIGIVCLVVFAGALWGALAAAGQLRQRSLLAVIMGGYALRVVIHFFIREVKLFSHVVGGDSVGYEIYARLIALIWHRSGVHFVDADELVDLGPTTLPSNLFALIAYIDDGPTMRLGCTAIVALAAGLTALNLYMLAVEFRAERKTALLFASIIYFQPSFLFYTSDMYKDGLVLCFTLGALGSALRLSYRFSVRHAIVGLVCIGALWYVRFYLIFVTVAPLVVGLVGLNTKGAVRSLLVGLGLAVGALAVAGFTDILQLASERASQTFDHGTSSAVLNSNSQGGSGVVFDDDGSPFGALPAKLAYTLFSPFPWAGGSLGFQLGKLDVFLWYFVLYRAIRGALQTDRRLVILLATFILPCTFMYAMSMANVGLIVRQRLVIVAAMTLLAALYKPKNAAKRARARDPRALRALKKLRAAA